MKRSELDLETYEHDALRAAMLGAIAGFKDCDKDNPIDIALDMLVTLPPSKLSDELLSDLNVFIRTVWNIHFQWKEAAKKGTKR